MKSVEKQSKILLKLDLIFKFKANRQMPKAKIQQLPIMIKKSQTSLLMLHLLMWQNPERIFHSLLTRQLNRHQKNQVNLYMIKMIQKTKIQKSLILMNLKMEQYIKDSGKLVSDMVEENNTGMMVLSMKDIGKIIWLVEKVD